MRPVTSDVTPESYVSTAERYPAIVDFNDLNKMEIENTLIKVSFDGIYN